MKRFGLVMIATLVIAIGTLSCHGGGGGDGGGCGADPSPITGKKLVSNTDFALTGNTSTTDKKFPCKEVLDDWNRIKGQLQTSGIIGEALDTKYNNYDFYKVTVSSSDTLTKYKDLKNQLIKNMEYQVTSVYKDQELNNVCKTLLPGQRKCPNCFDDVIAIDITNYIEHEQSSFGAHTNCYTPSHCRVNLTFCESGDTFILSTMNRESSGTVSEILDPECVAGISIQDGAIVFPKPIVKCIIKDKVIDSVRSRTFEGDIVRTNLSLLCHNDPLEQAETPTPQQEENNNEENEGDNDSQEVGENDPGQPEELLPTYTKLKLQLNQSCYNPDVGRPAPSSYVPRSVEQFLITPLGPSCASFVCTLE